MKIDRERLVEIASRMIATPSFTGDEEAMGRLMAETFGGMGLQTQWHQVEDGPPPLRVAGRGDDARWFIDRQIHLSRRGRNGSAVEFDPVHARVDACAQLGHWLAVHRHAAGPDELLSSAA